MMAFRLLTFCAYVESLLWWCFIGVHYAECRYVECRCAKKVALTIFAHLPHNML
jgi:hypothetical protein